LENAIPATIYLGRFLHRWQDIVRIGITDGRFKDVNITEIVENRPFRESDDENTWNLFPRVLLLRQLSEFFAHAL
jgi:hypothetical protein